jgi:TolB-like protein
MLRNNNKKVQNQILNYILLTVFAFILVCGCSTQKVMKPDTDVSKITRIAVLPFEDFTSDEYAGEKIRRIVITELLSRDIDVIEPGEVTRLLKDMNIWTVHSMKVSEIKAIGKKLGVDAMMSGSVESFGISKGISVEYPEVTINLMLIETSSGKIIWSTRQTSGGPSFWTRHFGSENISLSETARNVVSEALGTIF